MPSRRAGAANVAGTRGLALRQRMGESGADGSAGNRR